MFHTIPSIPFTVDLSDTVQVELYAKFTHLRTDLAMGLARQEELVRNEVERVRRTYRPGAGFELEMARIQSTHREAVAAAFAKFYRQEADLLGYTQEAR